MVTPEKAIVKGPVEDKTCPKCGEVKKYSGPIRCSHCNVFLLNARELEYQKKNIIFSERGRDEDAEAQNQKMKDDAERGNKK